MVWLYQCLYSHVPESLWADLQTSTETLLTVLDDEQQSRLQRLFESKPEMAVQLAKAMVGSQYVLEACCRDPSLLFHWLLADVAHTPLSALRIIDLVESVTDECTDIDELSAILRRVRRQLMVGILWRDFNRLSSCDETCQSMTTMAEVCLQVAIDFHYRELSATHGVPIGGLSGAPQPLLVIGMGKLGGAELNVSSDIDLIFAYPESGQTDHPKRPLDNSTFFTRLGQRLIKTLSAQTEDGFVFRVDMRLRPYGQSGGLVSSFAALEDYYHTQGRDWERFAMIKARIVAIAQSSSESPPQMLDSKREAIAQLEAILRPFAYRKYIDFSAIDALRRLKLLINQEVRRKGMLDDVKLGPGGIREIEFIAQSFQLIRGGRDPRLQDRSLLAVLGHLEHLGYLSAEIVDSLSVAYRFLRDTEHGIQGYNDQQTQQLPNASDECERLAWVMGYPHWDAFWDDFQRHREQVNQQFQAVVADPQEERPDSDTQPMWTALWQGSFHDEEDFLTEQGFAQPSAVMTQLQDLHSSRSVLAMSATARERLDLLMPQMLEVVAAAASRGNSPDATLPLMLGWLEKVLGRTAYLVLLLENPAVLLRLTQLCESSSWIAQQLAQTPSLLDELIDVNTLYAPPAKDELQDELRQQLLRLNPDDLETHMEVLRYFKLIHSLRVAASEVMGHLPLMKVSDYLTCIAEVILAEVLQLAWQQLVSRHGAPNGDKSPNFIVVAYGKLGGIELGYNSDLDLVFIYDTEAQGMTEGDKPIDNQTFYTRLGQKIIHILNTRTLSGQLYDVDMRLRPSGNSGLLVSSLRAFERYQLNDAWTWEHQALVRARVVTGAESLAGAFAKVRQQVLSQHRALDVLQQEVVEMREKMRTHLGSKEPKSHDDEVNSPQFHLKQDAGGIVDIEFMVQYAVLAWAQQQPSLVKYTDNIRILECLSVAGFISPANEQILIDAYKAYRIAGHRLALQHRSTVVEADLFAQERQQVTAIWQQLFNATVGETPR